ncbi:hypothetical protein J4Q44_G00386070 [Coregonus suidteri]|uniref:Uncharacterized protein n=1 Tax=Coregonus suidteri TaxID=861788 RepID=A0AAN8QIX7_9TELE
MHTYFFFFFSYPLWETNPQPWRCKRHALSTELHPCRPFTPLPLDDAGPIARRPMGLPVAAGYDKAWNQTRISTGTASTAMQCLRPLRHSGDNIYDCNLIPLLFLITTHLKLIQFRFCH